MRPILIFIAICFFSGVFSQDDGYVRYNKHRIGPNLEEQHQLVGTFTRTNIQERDSLVYGNNGKHYNHGLGAGYSYRVGLRNSPWGLAIGARGEWYPEAFYKFSGVIEADYCGYGTKNFSAFAVSEYQAQLVYNPSFDQHQWTFMMCIGEINVYRFSLQALIQGPIGSGKDDYVELDPALWIFKFYYRHNIHLKP